jgi:hypothetical protein
MIPEMTLQDWFAGQIIAAMIGSDPAYSSMRDNDGRLCGIEPARLANMSKNAYQTAEAMMQARAAVGKEVPAAREAVAGAVGGREASVGREAVGGRPTIAGRETTAGSEALGARRPVDMTPRNRPGHS